MPDFLCDCTLKLSRSTGSMESQYTAFSTMVILHLLNWYCSGELVCKIIMNIIVALIIMSSVSRSVYV